jgi:hypothetical protein
VEKLHTSSSEQSLSLIVMVKSLVDEYVVIDTSVNDDIGGAEPAVSNRDFALEFT